MPKQVVPGHNAITCEWLELMGLWNRSNCCAGCHSGEEGHFSLTKDKLSTGHTVMICFNALNCVDEETIEKLIQCPPTEKGVAKP